jgi:hypothetical protein
MSKTTQELISGGNTLAKALQNAEFAALVKELVAGFECAILAAREACKERDELKQQRDALAAENTGLKAGASYFSYGSEHSFEWHKTAEEAVEAAEAAIDDYRGDACDGWSEEVDSVCWGVIMQSSTKVGERPRSDEDRCDPAIDTICDYALLPNIETPATDTALAELKAKEARNAYESILDNPSVFDMESLVDWLQNNAENSEAYAAELRKESGK